MTGSKLSETLKKIVSGEVDDSKATRETYSRDASLFMVRPEVVVFPKGTDDIEKLVQFATQEAKNGDHSINLTPRAAGTDMSGGPLGNSIIVDVTRHMHELSHLEGGHATVEPGMFYRDFDKKTIAEGWFLPSYTASREICTVGGMVANNSGGEKNLKYGKTDAYVEELEVVLADGVRHKFRELTHAELEAHCDRSDFVGQVYRQMRKLIEENREVIEHARPTVSKNSSGYQLWKVEDPEHDTFNLARLIVGSQGTLGIITKIKFRLMKPKPHSAMAVMFLPDLAELGHVTNTVLAHSPESFESYDDHTFALAVKYFPEFAVQMKSNIFQLGFSFLPEVISVIMGGVPKLVLLAEFAGESAQEAEGKARALGKEIREKFGVTVKIAPNEAAARKYWVVRRESFNLLRKKVRGLRTAPFIDDFVVLPEYLPEFLPKLELLLKQYKFTYTIAGHVGDGNFHIIPLVDPKDPETPKMIDVLSHQVYDLVLEYKGSISGEHNDGLIRTPYVEKMFGHEMTELFQHVKKIFDPQNIFNPGKKVGTTFAQAYEHLDLVGVQKRAK